jgi:hypothetical protein
MRTNAKMENKLCGIFFISLEGSGHQKKYLANNRHKVEVSLTVMCRFFEVSRSGYYEFVKRLWIGPPLTRISGVDHQCQSCVRKTYGYRRVHNWLRKRASSTSKTVLGNAEYGCCLRFAVAVSTGRWVSIYINNPICSTASLPSSARTRSGCQ